jgi:hypothetical protein
MRYDDGYAVYLNGALLPYRRAKCTGDARLRFRGV